MFQKLMTKLHGWYMCLMNRFANMSNEKQYAIYAVIFILPMFLGYLLTWTFNIFLFVYYLVAYFFFQVGLTLTRK